MSLRTANVIDDEDRDDDNDETEEGRKKGTKPSSLSISYGDAN